VFWEEEGAKNEKGESAVVIQSTRLVCGICLEYYGVGVKITRNERAVYGMAWYLAISLPFVMS
jgi:hypothetical protein